jgi:two-component system alkaline phosphatase synthesis response regulator PhoP
MHVLVVDDDWSVAATCAEMLVRAGFLVSGAENGEQAWEALQCVHYHLVITDYLMPKASGLELARRMRRAGMMQPVILISGSPDIEKQVSDSRIPIDVILPKPFSFYELLNRINAVLDLFPRASLGARIFKSPQH